MYIEYTATKSSHYLYCFNQFLFCIVPLSEVIWFDHVQDSRGPLACCTIEVKNKKRQKLISMQLSKSYFRSLKYQFMLM